MRLNKVLMMRMAPIMADIGDRLDTHDIDNMSIIDKLMLVLDTVGYLDASLYNLQSEQKWLTEKARGKMFQYGVSYILNKTEVCVPGIPSWLKSTATKLIVGKLFKLLN